MIPPGVQDFPPSIKTPNCHFVMANVARISQPANPPPFGNASVYLYDMEVNFQEGPITFPNAMPCLQRYPDGINVVPLAVNSPVPVAVVGNRFSGYHCYILAREILHVVNCNGASPVISPPPPLSFLGRIRQSLSRFLP